MKAVVGEAPRAGKSVILVSVLLTSALWLLGVFAYGRIFRPALSDKCPGSAIQADGSTGPRTNVPQNESLALALASIASARPAEGRRSPEREAEPTAPSTSSSQGPPADPPPSTDELVAKHKADAHALDAQLLSEEVDPVWSAKVERATVEAVARVGGGVHLEEVTCRETLCRAKVTHLDPQRREEDTDRLLTMPVIVGQALALAPTNDDRSTTLYFSRKGTSLSVLQPPMPPPPSILTPDLPAAEERSP